MKEEGRRRKKERDGKGTENRMEDMTEVTDTVESEKEEIELKNKTRWMDWHGGVKVSGKRPFISNQ